MRIFQHLSNASKVTIICESKVHVHANFHLFFHDDIYVAVLRNTERTTINVLHYIKTLLREQLIDC